jgi:hypothetical protein
MVFYRHQNNNHFNTIPDPHQRGTFWKPLQIYKDFWVRFQRVRWQVVKKCLDGGEIQTISDQQWHEWLDNSIAESNGTIRQGIGTPYPDTKISRTADFLLSG